MQVDDIDTVTLGVNVAGHFRIPATGLVSEVDTCFEKLLHRYNAINEARKLHIPIVAIVDTNCDPDEIDYVIPANDDVSTRAFLHSIIPTPVISRRAWTSFALIAIFIYLIS